METTVDELARLVDGEVVGDGSLVITGITKTSSRKNVEGGEKKGTVEATFRAVLYMLEASHVGS